MILFVGGWECEDDMLRTSHLLLLISDGDGSWAVCRIIPSVDHRVVLFPFRYHGKKSGAGAGTQTENELGTHA